MNMPSHLIPIFNVCSVYCQYNDDEQLNYLLANLKSNKLTDEELVTITNRYNEISEPIFDEFNHLIHEMKLNYTSALTCEADKFIKCLGIMFTYLSINSNIILTNCLNSHIDLHEAQQAIINYLFSHDDSTLPMLRHSVANFIKAYYKPSLFERIFKRNV